MSTRFTHNDLKRSDKVLKEELNMKAYQVSKLLVETYRNAQVQMSKDEACEFVIRELSKILEENNIDLLNEIKQLHSLSIRAKEKAA